MFYVTLSGRRAVPSHYLLKIESFPSLSKAPIESYSSEFEAGGYKWCFLFYLHYNFLAYVVYLEK